MTNSWEQEALVLKMSITSTIPGSPPGDAEKLRALTTPVAGLWPLQHLSKLAPGEQRLIARFFQIYKIKFILRVISFLKYTWQVKSKRASAATVPFLKHWSLTT